MVFLKTLVFPVLISAFLPILEKYGKFQILCIHMILPIISYISQSRDTYIRIATAIYLNWRKNLLYISNLESHDTWKIQTNVESAQVAFLRVHTSVLYLVWKFAGFFVACFSWDNHNGMKWLENLTWDRKNYLPTVFSI